jgi:hypothetical protein
MTRQNEQNGFREFRVSLICALLALASPLHLRANDGSEAVSESSTPDQQYEAAEDSEIARPAGELAAGQVVEVPRAHLNSPVRLNTETSQGLRELDLVEGIRPVGRGQAALGDPSRPLLAPHAALKSAQQIGSADDATVRLRIGETLPVFQSSLQPSAGYEEALRQAVQLLLPRDSKQCTSRTEVASRSQRPERRNPNPEFGMRSPIMEPFSTGSRHSEFFQDDFDRTDWRNFRATPGQSPDLSGTQSRQLSYSQCVRQPANGRRQGQGPATTQEMISRFQQIARQANINPCAIDNVTRYINRAGAGRISNRRYVTVIDFSQSDSSRRMYVLDLERGTYERALVSRGINSHPSRFSSFSSRANSRQTPLGVHLTGQRYWSESLGRCAVRMNQQEMRGRGRSDNSESRGVVFHGANYVNEGTMRRTGGQVGRSWGCPGTDHRVFNKYVSEVSGGSIWYHFHAGLCR